MMDEGLCIRAIEREDLPYVVRWRQTSYVSKQFMSHKPITLSTQDQWYSKYCEDETDIIFIIWKNRTERIGMIGLSNIDFKNQKAELGRVVIGESCYLRKGYGSWSLRSVMDFGFHDLNLRKIYLRVFCDNMAATGLYGKLGFSVEGRLKQEYFLGGRWRDVLIMAAFRSGRGFKDE